jgi:hypothetical protein
MSSEIRNGGYGPGKRRFDVARKINAYAFEIGKSCDHLIPTGRINPQPMQENNGTSRMA